MKSSMNEQEFYFSTKDQKGDFIIYESESFRMSEIDVISLIKLCFVERRNVGIGRKLLDAYRDATSHKKEQTDEILNKIGIKTNGNEKPTTARKVKEK